MFVNKRWVEQALHIRVSVGHDANPRFVRGQEVSEITWMVLGGVGSVLFGSVRFGSGQEVLRVSRNRSGRRYIARLDPIWSTMSDPTRGQVRLGMPDYLLYGRCKRYSDWARTYPRDKSSGWH